MTSSLLAYKGVLQERCLLRWLAVIVLLFCPIRFIVHSCPTTSCVVFVISFPPVSICVSLVIPVLTMLAQTRNAIAKKREER